ncbi:ATP-binding protein [Streptomyces sp. DT171]|uniref:ATP-binding protein n=1 Tax=Streptomyces sp. DT171 TaxID=3416524 RepID=UPI003CF348B1
MRDQLRGNGVSDSVVDDAVLILSELLSNACRHGRPLGRHTEVGDGDVRAAWHVDRTGALTVEVTDGGGPTRPVPATPSVTARGGRGLNIIGALSQEWGVRDNAAGEVTVWVLVSEGHRRDDFAPRVPAQGLGAVGALADIGIDGIDGLDGIDPLDGIGAIGTMDSIGRMGEIDEIDGLDFADAG